MRLEGSLLTCELITKDNAQASFGFAHQPRTQIDCVPKHGVFASHLAPDKRTQKISSCHSAGKGLLMVHHDLHRNVSKSNDER
jgi:hypothetical protein